MKKERKDKHFVKKPEYPGGTKAMQKFLAKEKKYPNEAKAHKIEGTVHLRYTINHRGKVIKTKVISGLGYGCDEEAERIVKLLKFEVPHTHKMKVQYHKTIHIHFRMPKSSQLQTKISYSLAGDTKLSPESQIKKEDKSYHYKISW